jgi:hypothetical protein
MRSADGADSREGDGKPAQETRQRTSEIVSREYFDMVMLLHVNGKDAVAKPNPDVPEKLLATEVTETTEKGALWLTD